MIIREAAAKDAEALKVLYFEHLTKYPPQEEQNMAVWKKLLAEYENDNYNYILIAEENGEVVPVTDDLPKSFLLTSEYGLNRVYLVQFNTSVMEHRRLK